MAKVRLYEALNNHSFMALRDKVGFRSRNFPNCRTIRKHGFQFKHLTLSQWDLWSLIISQRVDLSDCFLSQANHAGHDSYHCSNLEGDRLNSLGVESQKNHWTHKRFACSVQLISRMKKQITTYHIFQKLYSLRSIRSWCIKSANETDTSYFHNN